MDPYLHSSTAIFYYPGVFYQLRHRCHLLREKLRETCLWFTFGNRELQHFVLPRTKLISYLDFGIGVWNILQLSDKIALLMTAWNLKQPPLPFFLNCFPASISKGNKIPKHTNCALNIAKITYSHFLLMSFFQRPARMGDFSVSKSRNFSWSLFPFVFPYYPN